MNENKVNLISGFFILEVNSWKETLSFYISEMTTLEEWLIKLLQFDTVPDLGKRVENYLNTMTSYTSRMKRMLKQLESFEDELYEDDEPVDNDQITESIRKGQVDFRQAVREMELDYLYLKNECDNFVADSLIIQNIRPLNGRG